MKSYREISQEYAQGGIKALLTLNGGAAVALLTQLKDLSSFGSTVTYALSFWALGTVLSAMTWMLAFSATRHFDEWEKSEWRCSKHKDTGNRYQCAGLTVWIAAVIVFGLGCGSLAVGFQTQPTRASPVAVVGSPGQ